MFFHTREQFCQEEKHLAELKPPRSHLSSLSSFFIYWKPWCFGAFFILNIPFMSPNHQVKAISASEPCVPFLPSDAGDGWHLFLSFSATADVSHQGWLWGASAPLSRKLFLCVATNFPPIIESLCVTICLDVDRGGHLSDIPINLSDSSRSHGVSRWKAQLWGPSWCHTAESFFRGVTEHKDNFFTIWWSA